MVSRNFRQGLPLEVGLMEILGEHGTLSVVRHVGLHVNFSSIKSSLGLKAFTFMCEVNLESFCPFDQ